MESRLGFKRNLNLLSIGEFLNFELLYIKNSKKHGCFLVFLMKEIYAGYFMQLINQSAKLLLFTAIKTGSN